jgi:hypothetical protein
MPQTIDVTGLPEPVVQDIQKLVVTLREKFGQQQTPPRTEEAESEDWIARFRAWAESHPKREIVIDDSRETIYGGRGQ